MTSLARRTLAIAVLRRLLDVTDADLESDVFRRRSEAFLFQRVAGRQVVVSVAGRPGGTAWTDRSGHFRLTVDLDAPAGGGATVDCTAESESGEGPPVGDPARGVIQLVEPAGASVISDIDDTVKVTNVADRRELLRNTLLRDFAVVAGMPDVFRGWQAAGTAFHYVSASPWQLSPCLCGFLAAAGLPAGSMHLKLFRLKDSMPFGRLPSRKRSKRRVIEQIMADFPGRRFLLVGDSGERDPEVYAAVAKKRPAQVAGVAIRMVESRSSARKVRDRLAALARALPAGGLTTFESPAELAARHGLSNAFW